jgi:hypothetical protein
MADNLPARFTGGLHYLVLCGEAPSLARLYPPVPTPNPETLWLEIGAVLASKGPFFSEWLKSPPQTNEVGRSSALMSGLLVVAEAFDLPLRLLELGSSAGLNLMLERYEHDLGGLRAGASGSPVRLAPSWEGAPPPGAHVRIASRRGVDLRPVDLVADGGKLVAFVWPDQIERRARLEAAIALSQSDPPVVDRADAADWLEINLVEAHATGSTCVVMHSIAFQYFPDATKGRISRAMEEAGKRASGAAPLAWLRFEQEEGEERPSLRLRLWPGGEDRLLAWCHGHGASVQWMLGS